MNIDFQTEVRAHLMLVLEREPQGLKIDVSAHKNVENLKMKDKVDQIPSPLLKNGLTRTM
jgi:hypothetical protein